MAGLAVRALGGFAVTVEGHEVERFRSVNVRGLLLHLLLRRPEVLRRDALAVLLWPEVGERTARQNLRQTIRRLRLVVDPEQRPSPRLEVTRDTVRLAPDLDVDLDVDAFRAAISGDDLERAVSLYRGELAPGLDCRSPAFDRWLDAERTALRRSAVDALDRLGRRALDRGDHVDAGTMASRGLELAPLHEPAHRLLVRALVLGGDRVGALAQSDECRRLLADELGVAPSPATLALADAIRDGSVDAGRRGARAHGRASDDPPDGPRSHRPTAATMPFVGRATEFGRLVEQGKAAVRDRRLRVSLVTGPAGIGKTRLAEQFLDWAVTRGDDVLRGRASAGGATTPFQVLVDLLRPRVDAENAPDDLLDDVWLSQLARLLPELHERYSDLSPPTRDQAVGRGHLHEGVTRVVTALARRRPVSVLVDDLPYADGASLDALGHAVRRWGDEAVPIHLVLTARSEGLAATPIATWLGEVERATTVERIDLATFTRAETAAVVVGSVTGDGTPRTDGFATADLVAWLHRNTAGHPLLVAESLKVLARRADARVDLTTTARTAEADPNDERHAVVTSLRRVVDAWLADLPPTAEQVLTAASVLADAATDDLLRAVARLDDEPAVAALDDLLRAGLLAEATPGTPSAPTYRFSHDLVADVVRDRAGPARRRLLHGRCVDAMRRGGTPAADVLAHAIGAGRTDAAIGLGIDAGVDALDLLAIPVANDHFAAAWELVEQHGWPDALDTTDRERLLDGLGRTHELLGHVDAAAQAYRELVADARAAGAAAVEARALCRLGDLATYQWRDHAAVTSLLDRALSVAADAGAAGLMAEAEIRLATAAFVVANDGDLAQRHAARAHDLALASGNDVALARHGTLSGSLAVVRGDWGTALEDYTRGRDAWAMLGDRVMVGDAARSVGYSQLMTGRPRAAAATLADEQDVARRSGNDWAAMECAWKLGHAYLDLGHYGRAVASSREAIDLDATMDHVMSEFAHDAAAHVHRVLHDHDRARAYLDGAVERRARRMSGSSTVMVHDDWAESELAAMAAVEGDWSAATLHARRRLELRRGATGLSMALAHWMLTDALLRAGDVTEARRDVDVLRATVGDNPRFRLILHRCDAVLAAHDGEHDHAAAELLAALRLAREIGLPGEEWPLLVALADAARDRGEPREADQFVARAAAIVTAVAESIDDEDVRGRYLAAGPIAAVLAAA